MRHDVMDTYITHPCCSGRETEVAATRIQTQVPQSCQGQAKAPSVSMRWEKSLLLPASRLASLLPSQAGPRKPFICGQCGCYAGHPWAGSSTASWHKFFLNTLGKCFKTFIAERKELLLRSTQGKTAPQGLWQRRQKVCVYLGNVNHQCQPSPARTLITCLKSQHEEVISQLHVPAQSESLALDPPQGFTMQKQLTGLSASTPPALCHASSGG